MPLISGKVLGIAGLGENAAEPMIPEKHASKGWLVASDPEKNQFVDKSAL